MPGVNGDRTWLCVTVHCPPAAVDAVTVALLPLSPNGVATDEAETVRITAWLGPYTVPPSGAEAEKTVREHLALIPDDLLPKPPAIEVLAVPEKDWIEVFRSQHRPVRIGRIVIKPTWEPWPSPVLDARADDVVVEIDPGLAFGTGLHPTTAGCVRELQDRLRRGARVIDFGCGSGVLAIVAAKLGARAVLAIDSDPTAVEVALENVAANSVEDRVSVRVGESLADVGAGWDIVVANISPPIIVHEAASALAALRPNGAYICAGIPLSREAKVLARLREVGFAGIVPRIEAEWVGFVCVAAGGSDGR